MRPASERRPLLPDAPTQVCVHLPESLVTHPSVVSPARWVYLFALSAPLPRIRPVITMVLIRCDRRLLRIVGVLFYGGVCVHCAGGWLRIRT